MCKKCQSINGMKKRKKGSRTVEVDYYNLGKAAGEALVGFGVSNVVSAKVKEFMDKDLPEGEESKFSKNTSGLVKLVGAAATAFVSVNYGGKMASDGINVAVGMGLSGALDLAKGNLGEETLTFAGLNGVEVRPLRRGRTVLNLRTGAQPQPSGVTQGGNIDLPYVPRRRAS